MGYIYFIGAPESDHVKIGYSYDPWKRIRQVQSGSPEALKVLYAFRAPKALEEWLHKVFAPSRAHGEWFANADLIREVAAALQELHMNRSAAREGFNGWPDNEPDAVRVVERFEALPVTLAQVRRAIAAVFPA